MLDILDGPWKVLRQVIRFIRGVERGSAGLSRATRRDVTWPIRKIASHVSPADRGQSLLRQLSNR
jgi:hypothetical protein